MIKLITLRNKNGAELTISNYGATILELRVPNRKGNLVNVVVGLHTPEAYTEQPYKKHRLCMGATVGRYAGRISGGTLNVEGEKHPIYNQNGVHLHGGKAGFDEKYWTIEAVNNSEDNSVKLSYLSKHLEENYPGNLQVSVTYTLLESNALKVKYTAFTDRTTVVNLTNHSYFNLNGKGSILDHSLQIYSDKHLDVDGQLVPTGQLLSSEQTRFDYNESSQIKSENFIGLDDTFVLKQPKSATLISHDSGICMQVKTQQPAMVVYTPKNLPDFKYSNDAKFDEFPAICFETQNFPDAPNNNNFPSSILKPGENYINETVFKFSTI